MTTVHNGITQYTGLLRGFRQLFGESAEFAVERLSETIQPVLDVFGAPEWALHRGERLCWGYVNDLAAGAGQYSAVGFRNPAGSNRLCVLEAVDMVPQVSALHYFVFVAFNLGHSPDSTQTGAVRDSRQGFNGWQTAGLLTTKTGAAGAAALGGVTGPWAKGILTLAPVGDQNHLTFGQHGARLSGLVMHPGSDVVIQMQTQNNGIEGTFYWRERQLLPGETSA